MTEQEAKIQIQSIPSKIWEQLSQSDNEAIEIAFKSLEKQIAKKIILNNPIINTLWCEDAKLCPVCHTYVERYTLYDYCKNCGQKLLLDWGNEDAE